MVKQQFLVKQLKLDLYCFALEQFEKKKIALLYYIIIHLQNIKGSYNLLGF